MFGKVLEWKLISSAKPIWITTRRIADAVQSAGSLDDPTGSDKEVIDLSDEGPGGMNFDIIVLDETGPEMGE